MEFNGIEWWSRCLVFDLLKHWKYITGVFRTVQNITDTAFLWKQVTAESH